MYKACRWGRNLQTWSESTCSSPRRERPRRDPPTREMGGPLCCRLVRGWRVDDVHVPGKAQMRVADPAAWDHQTPQGWTHSLGVLCLSGCPSGISSSWILYLPPLCPAVPKPAFPSVRFSFQPWASALCLSGKFWEGRVSRHGWCFLGRDFSSPCPSPPSLSREPWPLAATGPPLDPFPPRAQPAAKAWSLGV